LWPKYDGEVVVASFFFSIRYRSHSTRCSEGVLGKWQCLNVPVALTETKVSSDTIVQ